MLVMSLIHNAVTYLLWLFNTLPPLSPLGGSMSVQILTYYIGGNFYLLLLAKFLSHEFFCPVFM